LADLDVAHRIATAGLGDPDDSRMGLPAALQISIKLGVIERMASLIPWTNWSRICLPSIVRLRKARW